MSSFTFKQSNIIANGVLNAAHPPPTTVFCDFDGISLASHDDLVTVTQGGTPSAAAAISATAGDPVAGAGGWLSGSVDNVDDLSDEIAIGGLAASATLFRADQVGTRGFLAFEWACSLPALTARTCMAGVSDDPTDGTTGAMSIQGTDVITDLATDAAGFLFSSLATDADGWHIGATDSGTQDTAVSVATAAATTWVGLRTTIDVNGDCYFFMRHGRGVEPDFVGKSTNGLSPDVLLVPYFQTGSTDTTAVVWEVDYGFGTAVYLP